MIFSTKLKPKANIQAQFSSEIKPLSPNPALISNLLIKKMNLSIDQNPRIDQPKNDRSKPKN